VNANLQIFETTMPQPPEPPEIADQIGTPDRIGTDRGSVRVAAFDAGHEHACDLLRACHLEPDLFLDPSPSPRATPKPVVEPHPAAEWARSGAMALTGPAGCPPRFASGPLASVARGASLVLQSLAGDGRLDGLDGSALLGERAALSGLTRQGGQSAGGSAQLLPTRDGVLALNLPRADDWHLVPAWLETDLPNPLHDTPSDYAPSGNAPFEEATSEDERDAAWQRIAPLVANRDGDALVERGRLMGLAIARAPRPPEPAPAPRTPFFELRGETESTPTRDLRRLRLLDLSTLWAGPLATSLLATIGIDVLKIESPTRPEGARNTSEVGAKEFFDLMNGDKLACALDLRESRDRSIFEMLLETADIVVESARPRSLCQLGYDASGWVAARNGRIWASITGYGRANEWIAFGDDAATAAGLAWSPVADETDPCFCADAIADPLTGIHVASIILAHLRQGHGGLFDISLSGIARRAASAAHDGLVLPIERATDGWYVTHGDRAIPIEEPRARPIRRAAPELAAPCMTRLSKWLDPTC